jgi:hypothetical protein
MRTVESIPSVQGEKDEIEEAHFLDRLWVYYKFYGAAPVEGSPAAKRLKNLCDNYVSLLLGQGSSFTTEDSENYFSKSTSNVVRNSDKRRRNIHNDICLMTLGRSRESITYELAEKVSDFACYYSKHKHIQDIV